MEMKYNVFRAEVTIFFSLHWEEIEQIFCALLGRPCSIIVIYYILSHIYSFPCGVYITMCEIWQRQSNLITVSLFFLVIIKYTCAKNHNLIWKVGWLYEEKLPPKSWFQPGMHGWGLHLSFSSFDTIHSTLFWGRGGENIWLLICLLQYAIVWTLVFMPSIKVWLKA